MIGQTISHYKILSKLGEGGMGVVYKAEDTSLERPVALKFLAPHLVSDEEVRKRFVREARTAAALNHPNICPVYEIGEADGKIFIAMAHLDGCELSEALRQGPLETGRVLGLGLQVAEGLAEAHAKGIVHRDIKPANLFVTSQERAVVLDFGLARLASADLQLTREGTALGTCAYMSPEQTTGEAVDARSDVWALGCVLYEMLTGEPPFRGEYAQAIVYSILNEQPSLPDGSSTELQHVLRRCLAKKPGDRYQDAAELVAELKQLGSGETRPSHSAPSGSAPSRSVLSRAAPTSSTATGEQRPLVAVLPFQNRSLNVDDEYFSDGVTEDVISTLGKLSGIRVVPRASAFQFKGKQRDVGQVVAALRATHVVEGSIRRAGDRLRITVELIDAAEGEQLWTDRYDREMRDIFDVQEELANAIGEALKGRLTGEQKRLIEPGTDEVEAYENYLRGLHASQFWSRQGFLRSFDHFEKAIELDPNYAQAHAGLAHALCMCAADGYEDPKIVMQRAREAADRALELNDSIAEAHLALGSVREFFDWDWEGAEQSYRRAVSLDPNSSVALSELAMFLSHVCRLDEALEVAQRALEFDPLQPYANRVLGWVLYASGKDKEAIRQLRRTIELNPAETLGAGWLAIVLAASGQIEEAEEVNRHALERDPNYCVLVGIRGSVLALAGRRKEALAVAKDLEERREREYVAPFSLVMVYSTLGEYSTAMDWLEKAYEQHDGTLAFLKVSRTARALRGDPRFETLMCKLNFPE